MGKIKPLRPATLAFLAGFEYGRGASAGREQLFPMVEMDSCPRMKAAGRRFYEKSMPTGVVGMLLVGYASGIRLFVQIEEHFVGEAA
jgi:hypothetical protein